MESIVWMIDEALRVWQTKTAIARYLGVTPQRLNDWSCGYRHMPAEKIEQLATIEGLSPALQIGRYEIEWRKKKRASAGAGIAGLVLFLAVSTAALGLLSGDGKGSNSARETDRLHIMRKRLVAWLQRLTKRTTLRLSGRGDDEGRPTNTA